MIKQLDGSITHVGLVRDFYVVEGPHGEYGSYYVDVFNLETEKLERVSIGYESWSSRACLEYTIDLLPQYEAIIQAKIEAKRAEIEAKTLDIGKTIKVTAGKHKGLIGKVFWKGNSNSKWRGFKRVGFKCENETFFVDENCCEVYFTELQKALA